MKAFAELNEKGDRVEVHFQYNPTAVVAIKAVPGRKFIPKDQGGPHWTVPLDLTTARRLREEFGDDLELGVALKKWGKEAVAKERELRSLSVVDDAELDRVPQLLPELYAGNGEDWPGLRSYQKADIKFFATTNAMNLNEQGLGKTVEIIAAVYEAGLEAGPHLVVAPRTSLELVWRYELERWQDIPVYTWSGDVTKTERVEIANAILAHFLQQEPFWFCTTADMVRKGLPVGLDNIEWSTFTIDEFHKTGLPEIKNKFPKAAGAIKAERRFVMSGTPMGGKPIKLWGGLHFLEPKQYTSKWRWAEHWLTISENNAGYKDIGGILPGREDEFYASLAPHAVRRLKSEVLPQLPPKIRIDVWCPMTPKQAKQYHAFALDAEVRIEEERLSAIGILAEYTRLKQFSNSLCDVERRADDTLRVMNTPESGKLPYLMDKLAEVGIDPDDPEGDAVAVIGSQFREMVDMVHAYLNAKGIRAEKITGPVSGKKRADLVRRFQAGGSDSPRVVVMTTTAGGVSITLDRADTVHILDETWVPDDQVQLEDRVHRMSRMHQVTVFYYRSSGTVEEYIKGVTDRKAFTNESILDIRRQGFRATVKAKGLAA